MCIRTCARSPQWENTTEALQVLAGFASVLVVGQLVAGWQVPFLDLPYFVLLATFTIYIAAHRSRSNDVRQQISLTQVANCFLTALLAGLHWCLVQKRWIQNML